MKNHWSYCLIFLGLLLRTGLFSQSLGPDTLKAANKIDPSETAIQRLLHQEFTSVVTGKSNSNLGNFASLDMKDAKVDFNGNVIISDRSILGIRASGSVSDGLLPVFSNSELNSNVQLDLQFNYRLGRVTTYIKTPEKSAIEFLIDSLNIAQEKEVFNIRNFQSSKKYIEGFEKYSKQKILIPAKIQNLESLINSGQIVSDGKSRKMTQSEIDSLKNELNLSKIDLKETKMRLKYLQDTSFWKKKALLAQNKYRKTISRARDSMMLYGYVIRWISISYGFGNQFFRLHDKSLTPADQITKHDSRVHQGRVAYVQYKYLPHAFGSYFFNVGFGFKAADNLADLTSSEFTEITQFGPNPNDRFTTKKFNAYNAADYKKSSQYIHVFSELYWFLDKKNSVALHWYPESRISDITTFNNGFGLFLAFQDKKEKSSVVNTEVYLEINDLFNAKEVEETSVGKRTSFGLRFAFPITFKNNF